VSAPKQRPVITGQTTLAELSAILDAHGINDVVAQCGGGSGRRRWVADLDGYGPERRSATLHEAIHEALRDMRMAQAEELDLTPDEAAS
jgi:hypothetical protein